MLMLQQILLLLTTLSLSNAATCTSNVIDIAMCLDNSGSMGSGYSDVQTFAKTSSPSSPSPIQSLALLS